MAGSVQIVIIDGINYGEWDNAGGHAAAWANTVRPTPTGGNRGYEGRKTHEPRTVSKVYVPSRDPQIVELIRKLMTSDRPPSMIVIDQPLDDDGRASGKPLSTATGQVGGYNAGDYDVTSDEPRALEVTLTTESVA